MFMTAFVMKVFFKPSSLRETERRSNLSDSKGDCFATARNDGDELEEYFLAGRRLTLPMFVATLVTTWYGNLLGTAEFAYKEGMVQWLTQGLFWYAVYIFFALFLAKKIRESKLFTLPDQLENFYDSKTAILGAVINLIMLNPAPYILSMGVIFEIVLGLPAWQGLIIGTLVPFLYTFRGGFKAVVITDMIQFVFMFLGLALIIPFAIQKFGFDNLMNGIPKSHLTMTGTLSWQVILAWFLIATWSLVDTSFFQRTYAAQDVKTAQRGILLATAFWFVFDFMITFTGIFAFTVMPDLDPKTSLPVFASAVLPPIAKGIFFTGLIATVMSTLDSLTFSSAMCISKDLYQKIFKVTDAKKIIAFNKLAIVIVVVLGLIVALSFESLIKIMYYKGSVGISGLLIPLLAGFFLKKKLQANTAFLSMLLGSGSCILWIALQKLNLIPWEIEPLFLGLGSSLLVILFNMNKKDKYEN
jgi:solute:Na+ symporter, SSS family